MKFINTLIATIKSLDLKTIKIMKSGFKISFLLILFSCYILVTYHLLSIPTLFYIGLLLFKSALTFGVAFFICAIGFGTIRKEIG